MFYQVELHFNTVLGHRIDVAYLPTSLCKPKCLVASAVAAGAIFATCPLKYGGRQFVNPKYAEGCDRFATPKSAHDTPSEARREAASL